MKPDLAVLIPTLGRHEKLPDLLESLRAATVQPYRVYFIVEHTDTDTRTTLAGKTPDNVTVVAGEFGSCAVAMNAGYRASQEPFFFTGNDDLWFHDAWDAEAMAVMEADKKQVCGTNDGNGRMTCFAVVERKFIEQQSGVYDVPNTVYHPYVSQYCDTEFAEFAKHRGAWCEAPRAVTEHLHWEFGKADPDHPNYLKARSTHQDDAAVFQKRQAVWTAR